MFSLQLPVIVQYSYGHQVVQSQNVLESRKKNFLYSEDYFLEH